MSIFRSFTSGFASIVIAVSAAICLASPAFAATGSITDNSDGSITVTYSGFTGTADLYLCATSIAANSCSPLNATYVWGGGGGPGNSVPSSPATITAGMSTRSGGTYAATTVAAGTYNAKLFDAGFGGSSFVATASNVVLGAGGGGGTSPSSSSSPAPVVQEFGMPASGTCDAAQPEGLNWAGVSSGGWANSWSQWMNGYQGGFVCTRTLVYSTTESKWILG